MTDFMQDQLESNHSSWLLQPSYDMQHLLLTQGRLPCQNVGLAASGQSQSLIHEVPDIEWSGANQYYFKGLASLQLLRQICLNFHKDFTLEQVNAFILFETIIFLMVLPVIDKISDFVGWSLIWLTFWLM